MALPCALLLVLTLTACTRASSAPATTSDQGSASEVHIGFLPNVTQAAPLIAIDKGFFTKELGGSLDAIFIGSGPPINTYAKYGPQSVRLVAGAATVTALIRGELDAVDYAQGDRAGAEAAVNDQLTKLTGEPLSGQVLDRSFDDLQLTLDPIAAQFPQLAKNGVTAGVATKVASLRGFADLRLLNAVLRSADKPAVSADGLGPS